MTACRTNDKAEWQTGTDDDRPGSETRRRATQRRRRVRTPSTRPVRATRLFITTWRFRATWQFRSTRSPHDHGHRRWIVEVAAGPTSPSVKTVTPTRKHSALLAMLRLLLRTWWLFLPRWRMQTRSSDENFVCPSICLSNACIVTKWNKDLSIFLYRKKEHLAVVFWEEEWLVGGDPLYLKFWVNRPPLERNHRFWTDIRS